MTIGAGDTLLHYRVVEKIGAGGMGEVYSAEDTRLGRSVAIKLLPAELRHDPLRLARLAREARLLASLNHPSIATLHGLEESADGTRFLVMELVEGETLASRLQRGPVPLRDLYSLGAQIAEALAEAHGCGITHRDLKPGNIMLTRTGVKLLDFGLAKAARRSPAHAMAETRTRGAASERLTGEGALVGTFHYMAPEQLEGRDADARSDIWALGAVLHEMSTGRPPFDGGTAASIIAAILEREPARVSEVCAVAPPAFDHLVRTCLAKDPGRRRQSAGDLALDLRWLAAGGASIASIDGGTEAIDRARWRERLLWLAGVTLLAGVATVAWLVAPRAAPGATAGVPVRFELALPALAWTATDTALALSPRGDALVYMSRPAPGRPAMMWLRELDTPEPRLFHGTEDARNLFWSPDGRRIGYVKDKTIRVVDRAGGPVQTVARAAYTFGPPAWAADGTILFSGERPDGSWGLLRVVAGGGEPEEVRGPAGQLRGIHPSVLPDGKGLLYLGAGDSADDPEAVLYLSSLDGRDEPLRIDGVRSRAEYAAGHLFYWDQGRLVARRLDLASAGFIGEPISVGGMIGAAYARTGMAQFSVARDGGAVAYATAAPSVELTWLERSGHEVDRLGEPGLYGSFRIAPDGDRVAVTIREPSDGKSDIAVFDVQRGVPTRLVVGPGDDTEPVWSADGQRIAYSSDAGSPPRIFIRPADGSGEPIQLRTTDDRLALYPQHWSTDGEHIVYAGWTQDQDLFIARADGTAPSRLFAGGPGDQTSARFSPDGRWIAFASSEMGPVEIFVAPVADGNARQRVSAAGGRNPVWSPAGDELYYVNDDTLYAATFSQQTGQIGAPRALFSLGEPRMIADLDITPNGERFLAAVGDRSRSGSVITVLLNWTHIVATAR